MFCFGRSAGKHEDRVGQRKDGDSRAQHVRVSSAHRHFLDQRLLYQNSNAWLLSLMPPTLKPSRKDLKCTIVFWNSSILCIFYFFCNPLCRLFLNPHLSLSSSSCSSPTRPPQARCPGTATEARANNATPLTNRKPSPLPWRHFRGSGTTPSTPAEATARPRPPRRPPPIPRHTTASRGTGIVEGRKTPAKSRTVCVCVLTRALVLPCNGFRTILAADTDRM